MKGFVLCLAILIGMVGMAWAYTPHYEDTDPIVEYTYTEELEAIHDWVIYGTIEEDNEVELSREDFYILLIGECAERYGVPRNFAVAISIYETGWWTSKAFQGHNFGGITIDTLCSYDTEGEGLEDYMACLKYWCDKGYDTPEKLAEKWCPVNAKEWAYSVREIMEDLWN